MGETSQDGGYAADPDEAAFRRLAEGLAALRRDTDRLREAGGSGLRPQGDDRALTGAIAELRQRVDALADRVEASGDAAAILAAAEVKIGSLSADLSRFVERGALTEAMDRTNARIDTLTARIDARLNRIQELQAELNAGQRAPVAAAARRWRRPGLAVLLLVALGVAAACMLALLRPDLVRPDWLRREWVEPVRDRVSPWLRLGSVQPKPPSPAATAEALAPVAAPVASPVASPVAAPMAPPMTAEAPSAVAAAPAPGAPTAGDVASEAETAAAGPAMTAPTVQAPPPPPPPAAAPAQTAPSPVIAPADAPPVRAAAARPTIVLGARADVWLMVQDGGGRTLIARTLREGETWKAPDLPDLRLSTGNAGATVVLVDGVPLPSLGPTGGVRRDISFDSLAAAGRRHAAPTGNSVGAVSAKTATR